MKKILKIKVKVRGFILPDIKSKAIIIESVSKAMINNRKKNWFMTNAKNEYDNFMKL